MLAGQDIPVGPEVVVGTIVGGAPAVGTGIAIGDSRPVGTPVVVPDPLRPSQHQVCQTLPMPTHLERGSGEVGDGLGEVDPELSLATLPLLRRDEDDPITRARPVEGGRGCVLEHLDRLNG